MVNKKDMGNTYIDGKRIYRKDRNGHYEKTGKVISAQRRKWIKLIKQNPEMQNDYDADTGKHR